MCKLQRITHKLRKAQGLCFIRQSLHIAKIRNSGQTALIQCLLLESVSISHVNVTILSESADTDALLFF